MHSVFAHLLEQPDRDVCIDGDEGQPGTPQVVHATTVAHVTIAAPTTATPTKLPETMSELLAVIDCDLPLVAAGKLGISCEEYHALYRKLSKSTIWLPPQSIAGVDRDMWHAPRATGFHWVPIPGILKGQEKFNTGEELQDIIHKKPAGHEVLTGAVKPYYDIDISGLPGKTKADTKAYRVKWTSALTNTLAAIYKLYPLGRIFTFSSSGRDSAETYKVSFHFIVAGGGFYKCGKDIPAIDVEGYDKQAYKGEEKRQCFRLPYAEAGKSSENGKPAKFPRFKCLVNVVGDGSTTDPDDIIEDMAEALADYTYEEWLPSFTHGERLRMVEEPEHKAAADAYHSGRSVPAVGSAAVEAAKLSALLALIPNQGDGDRVIQWGDWQAIVWGAKQHACRAGCYAEGLAAVQAWSAKNPLHDEAATLSMWNGGKTKEGGGGFSIGTLHYYAKTHNKTAYYEWVKKRTTVSRSKFDRKDPYCWFHFAKQYEGTHWPSYDTMVGAVMKDAPRVIAYIRSRGGWYIQKTDCGDGIYSYLEDLKKENFKLTYDEEVITPGKGKEPDTRTTKRKAAKVGDFLRDSLQKFQCVTCDFSEEPNDDKFNTYDGMAAVNLSGGHDADIIAPLLRFLFNTVSCDSREVYEYLINMLARVVQNPTQPVGVAIVLHGIQGTGKDTFVEFLRDFLFGKHLYCGFSGLESATAKFNAEQQGKKMFYISEAASTREAYISAYQMMKGLITSDVRWIEPKGQARYSIPAADFWIISTNNTHSVYLDDSDRRYFAFSMNPKTANDADYFAELRDQIMTEEVGNHFYTYLMSYTTSRALLSKIPKTELRETLLEGSGTSTARFARHKKSMIRAVAEPTAAQLAGWKVPAANVYEEYGAWCTANREPATTGTKFGREFAEHFEKIKTSTCAIYNLANILK